MSALPAQDRRQFPRRPKLIRFLLQWRGAEERTVTTDASNCGIFLRTMVVPPVDTLISLVVPEARPTSDCIRVEGRVARHVPPGDARNPLGGIGVELQRFISPLGIPAAVEFAALLFGAAPESLRLSVLRGAVRVELPTFEVAPFAASAPTTPTALPAFEEFSFTAEPTINVPRTVHVEIAAFCRWNNMVIQASLRKLGSTHAVIGGLKVIPRTGDPIGVRLMSQRIGGFNGAEFLGRVDQVHHDPATGQTLVSLMLDPIAEQPNLGGLRAFVKRIAEAPPSEDGEGT